MTHGALLTGCVVFAFPFVWLVSTSFKYDEEIFVYPPQWIPVAPPAVATSPFVTTELLGSLPPKESGWEEERWRQLEPLLRQPTGLAALLLALDLDLDTPKEIVVVRPAADDGGLAELIEPLRRSFVPTRVLMVAAEGPELAAREASLPLLRGKVARSGRATAYVCENQVCAAPTSDAQVFERQIRKVRPLDPAPR